MRRHNPFLSTIIFLLVSGAAGMVFGLEGDNKVELQGDEVQFAINANQVIAQGNVSIRKENITLFCDYLEFFHDSQIALAEGNVVLIRDGSRLEGDRLNFNFETMQGHFLSSRISVPPFYGEADRIVKLGDNHLQFDRGGITTCDLDKPHFRLVSRKIDIYPGEKAVARHVRFMVGKVPLMYLPRFTQDLRDKKPVFLITPGYDKEWGTFLLTRYRYMLNDNLKGTLRLDWRERKDVAWGIDVDYDAKDLGTGMIRTYYMNERSITSKHFWQERPSPTIERERFKVEWRHRWEVDERTRAVWQYYKLSDADLLKDYFRREYEQDANPDTYFLMTHAFPRSVLSFRTDARVNRFTSQVERLPEIAYDLPYLALGDTGLYFRNRTTYSNLTNKTASPSEIRQKTMRVDTDSEVSYPMKLAFIELRPFVGGRQTYYSRMVDPDKNGSIRGFFRTGADLSTKFYRIFDAQADKWGLQIDQLRHIVTPSVAYLFQREPTINSSQLDQFDAVDSLSGAHLLNFSLENKLQTKRGGRSVDLLRLVIGSNFRLKEDAGPAGFNEVTANMDVRPTNWLTFYSDAAYDSLNDRLRTSNFDLYVHNDSQDWYVKLGKRYHVDVDDQITTEFGYKINPKWHLRTYQRFDIDQGIMKEQQYTLTRDLHCWTMDVSFNSTRGEGEQIWVVFTLKAFPELGFDFSTRFNRRKAGSQSQ